MPGTSPRAWGKEPHVVIVDVRRRNIPTCVGKSWSQYPVPFLSGGISPRAWGKEDSHNLTFGLFRNIPTCVGKSRLRLSAECIETEHPHVRGEKFVCLTGGHFLAGTSPRAWGKVADKDQSLRFARNIPTYVGKRSLSLWFQMWIAEHPHVRGEKERSVNITCHTCGTSPRAWGKDRSNRKSGGNLRNIPTRVGKSRGSGGCDINKAEHPHARGEKAAGNACEGSPDGTSPRAWGKDVEAGGGGGVWRNIPTRVGKRKGGYCSDVHHAEHPHARGEKFIPANQ